MYDKNKADIKRRLNDIRSYIDDIDTIVHDGAMILNNATRLAVLEECLVNARSRVASARYDLSQTEGYGQAPNVTKQQLIGMDEEVAMLERLVFSAQFAVKHEG